MEQTNENKPMMKALIYCRVSSQRQVNEGSGLESQEHRNKQYASNKNYKIVSIFKDEGISGAEGNRPAFNKLLGFIDNHPKDKFVVIVDDSSRIARDMRVHLALRKSLNERQVRIESPNFNFEDSAEGLLVENVTAAVNQYGREQNARQVKQKMKARIDAGYWPFCPPPGLVNRRDSVHGKILHP